ncbi:GL23446 [Drosophila persimilis]|uniref:GL23446 n=1 Tax=Drosophila persimilis TaxID=7234 RepID=B4G3N2_DROPE|nr:GL23446 [Drosophila persimilis]
MPFVQRVVQPVNVAQATAASLGHASTRFHCAPGKCKNNNCINKQSPEAGTDVADCRATSPTSPSLTRVLVHVNGDGEDGAGQPHPPAALPMKKLKQHVEFLSTSPTHGPSRASQSLPNSRHPSQQRPTMARNASAPHSPTAGSSKVVSGHEFDSISNITLSNALRQLASLVLIASDIFDDLQRDLQSVGERAGRVQRKIAAVERRVCAYDPKMVTVPESDLLTFAQRKEHYETDKSFQQELFTGDTRPLSVRQLYTEAGKDRPVGAATAGALAALAQSNATATGTTPPRSISFNGDGTTGAYHNGHDVLTNGGGVSEDSEDYLICVSDFGNANRKLRTRIDAEIEIRLPAAIEDLRKWTSSEALGDVTVTPDCMHHVDTSISTSMVIGDSGVHTPALSPSVLSADAADALYAQNLSQAADSSSHHHHHPSHHHNQALLPNDINKDVPLNHRLPSPEEQTKQIALKYPAEVISVNISGKNFQRMCAARKSTAGCFAGGTTPAASSSSASPENGQTEANNLDDNVQTVSRRSRSRKVRGKRRNTIAGIDQKEIQDAANGNGESSSKQNASSSATSPAPAAASADTPEGAKKSKKFGRSKSSDILKKESVALPYDKGKSTLTRLNSLKQWGRNRFKFMHRAGELNGLGESSQLDTSGCSSQNSSAEKPDSSSHGSPPGLGSSSRDIDEDLKRRKGAHTTFAPGPYVKETESALLSATRDAATGESATSAAAAAAGEPGSIEAESTATSPLTATTKSAKLLLLSSGGIAGNHRKVANVRPIVAKSPLSKIPQSSSMAAYQSATVGGGTYQEQKQLLANHTNPFYETIAAAAAAPATGNMMPSPSGNSNSSTGSTATNSSSSTASAHSGEEGYQRFSNIYEQVQPAQTTTQPTDDSATPFQRSAPIYWTLQSRRNQQKAQPSGNVTCRDDLYATPIRRADRLARAAAATGAAGPSVDNPDGKSNISPIVPRTRGGAFLTSTPTRGEVEKAGENAQVPPMKQPSRNWSDDAPERLNTCADRIGQSKTTLMDFKKLLLAKSAKTSPVQRKMSAVELLKKSCGQTSGPAPTTKASGPAAKVGTAAPGAAKATINSSLKLLDLSGSPKTFANRRMLRQGQFGSPSKTFVPKARGPVNVVAAASAAPRTDIMSTTIPEANSEEDHSNTSGGSRASSEAGETAISPPVVTSSYDLKRNFFLQTEQNNFMRGEFKHTFAGKGGNSAGSSAESNKCANAPLVATALPSFETAL